MDEALAPIETLDTELGESSLASVPQSGNLSLPDPLEGTTLGPAGRYKILQRIGEGGFGTVYMAEQTSPVRRRVAIKVLKAGMDTRQVIARFEAERQALAMMDHPNIAKVLDGGETDHGRPYFVMELVRGTPVTAFCDREQLDTSARLSLFLKICRAVQHAHQKGIIHRDLKPGNILVTVQEGAEPAPKVIDFGVAKAMESNLTDKTLFTRFEQMIGTPAYMSPEQAGTDSDATDIDTRADIYALGVLLYELLTGSTPFKSETLQNAAFDEVRRILRDEEAPRPSARLSSLESSRRQTLANSRNAASPATLDKQLCGDLDWIVMKAIEKDRRRRYETANAFALDLERFLDDDPVEARPPSNAYRLKKFARRHRSWLAVAAAILVVLIAATAISTWQAIRATRAEALAEDRRAEAEAISEFLTGMFESARPESEAGGRTFTVAESLKIAEKKLEEAEKFPPERRAILQGVIGDVYQSLGRRDDALALRQRVHRLVDETLGSEHPDTLAAMRALATSYDEADRWEEAQAMREEVLTQSRKVLGPEHLDTLRAMQDLAISYGNNDRPYNNPDLWDEALAMREKVVNLRRELLGPQHPDTVGAMYNLASSYALAGRRDEALAMQEDVLNIRRRELGPEHPDTIGAMNNLANSYFNSGRWDEALAMREEELRLRRKVLGLEHPNILEAMYHLSKSYGQAKRWEDQLNIREEMLALSRKILGPEHYQTLDAMRHVANTYAAMGRRDEALKLREEVLALDRKVLGKEHSSTLRAMYELADSYDDSNRKDEALAMREDGLELWRKGAGPEHPDTVFAMRLLANSYAGASRDAEAVAMLDQVLTIDPECTLSLAEKTFLAEAYEKAGRIDEALAMYGGHLPLNPESPAVEAVLVSSTSEWRWLHPLDGIDPAETDPNFHNRFFHADYDDSNWQTGVDSAEPGGGFGYGDDGFTGVDIGTPAEKSLGKSAYFRHQFTTEAEFSNLELRCHRDDGIIVYLDGEEVVRCNVVEGEEAYRLPAPSAVAGDYETQVLRHLLADLTLPPGKHVLAISLHNTEQPSSDLRIGAISLVKVVPAAPPAER